MTYPPYMFPTAFGDPGPSSALVGPAGEIVADLPCRKCGYNLRGLAAAGRCPECGSAAALSVHGNLLRYSDPTWVRTLRRGAKFIVYGIAVGFLGVVITVILGVATRVVQAVAVMGIAVVVGYLLILAGTWQLTEPDPSGIGEEEYGTARKLIRITLLVGLLNSILSLIQSTAVVPPEARVAFEIIGFAAGVAALVGFIAQLRYLKKLSLRIPDVFLADRAHFLTYALGISYGLALMNGLAMQLTGGAGTPAGATTPFTCAAGILGLAMLVFFVMYLFMLERLAKRFQEEAAVAEQTWARAEAVVRAAPPVGTYAPPSPPAM